MKNARASGVAIVCGSDIGVFAHGTNLRERERMFAYGISIAEVHKASTVDAANVLQMEDEPGLIAPNYLADMIIVEDNPLQNLITLQTPVLVFKNGVKVIYHRK